MTAKTETTPMIGRDIGRTIDQSSRNGPAPSTCAASKISRGKLSKKRFINTTFKAPAPAGSHTAQYESISLTWTTGTFTTVRYSGTNSTIEGTNNVARTKPVRIRLNRGRRTDRTYPAVVAMRI